MQMAGKPKPMSQIKQLLRLHQQGSPKKTIARRDLGVSKNTVKAYLDKLSRLKTDVDSLLLLDDPVLEARFHPGNPAYRDERFEHFKGKLNYFTSELKRTGVTRKLLWEEYRLDYAQGYSHTQFCHHLSQHLIASKLNLQQKRRHFRIVFVIQPGLEPGTYSLEGYCSNPTELLDRPCFFSIFAFKNE